jgi:hypothetical protein
MYIIYIASLHKVSYQQSFTTSQKNQSLSVGEGLVSYNYNLFIVKSSVAAGTKRNVVSVVLTTVFSSFKASTNSSK